MLSFAIGVVHGKVKKDVVSVEKHTTVPRSIRYSIIHNHHDALAGSFLCLLPKSLDIAIWRNHFNVLIQELDWRSSHKNECHQILGASNDSDSILPDARKGRFVLSALLSLMVVFLVAS